MKVTTFEHAKKQGRFEMQTTSKVVKDIGLGTATQDPGDASRLLKHDERGHPRRLGRDRRATPSVAIETRCQRLIGGDHGKRSGYG